MIELINGYEYGWHLFLLLCIIPAVVVWWLTEKWFADPILPDDSSLVEMPNSIETADSFSAWIDLVDAEDYERLSSYKELQEFIRSEIESGKLTIGDPPQHVLDEIYRNNKAQRRNKSDRKRAPKWGRR
jgi:hypothetical protein